MWSKMTDGHAKKFPFSILFETEMLLLCLSKGNFSSLMLCVSVLCIPENRFKFKQVLYVIERNLWSYF